MSIIILSSDDDNDDDAIDLTRGANNNTIIDFTRAPKAKRVGDPDTIVDLTGGEALLMPHSTPFMPRRTRQARPQVRPQNPLTIDLLASATSSGCTCCISRQSLVLHVENLTRKLPAEVKDLEHYFVCDLCNKSLPRQAFISALNLQTAEKVCSQVDRHIVEVLKEELNSHGERRTPKRTRADTAELRQASHLLRTICALEAAMGSKGGGETEGGASGKAPATKALTGKKAAKGKGTGYGGDKGGQGLSKHMSLADARRQAVDSAVLPALQDVHTSIVAAVGTRGNKKTPPMLVCSVVCGSSFESLLYSLIAHDSLLEIFKRRNLYKEVMGIIHALTTSTELTPLLWRGLDESPSQEASSSAGGRSVFSALKAMDAQCATLKRTAEQLVDASFDEAAALGLALDVSTCCDAIERVSAELRDDSNQEQAPQPGPSKASPQPQAQAQACTQAQLEARYCEAVGEHRLRQWPLVEGKDFYFRSMLKQKGSGQKKGLLRLCQEIGSLSSSLPVAWATSIFLVSDESRMDVLRAMIIGPEDTPYENGIYLFDIYMPPDYPNHPPKVHFLTTGGGAVRFNPNLYQDGKVCLSLLGTWHGPSWDPKTSTLLQVLVSIQSMILVCDPYFNEPGYAHSEGTAGGKKASEQYNSYTRLRNLDVALLPFVLKPPPAFEEVLRIHFKLKREAILKMVRKWIAVNPQAYSSLGDITKKLETALCKYK